MKRALQITFAAGLFLPGLAAQDDLVRAAIATLCREGTASAHCDALALLARSGAAAEPAMSMIAELIGDARAKVRNAAVAALIELAPHGTRAVPVLIAQLDSPDEDVRTAARAALDVVAVKRQRGIEEQRDALRSGDLERQRPVLVAIRSGVGDARALLPDLIARLAVETPQFVMESQSVVRELATSSHVAALVAALRGAEQRQARSTILEILLDVAEADAPEDHGLDPLLLELARSGPSEIRHSVLRALVERAAHRKELLAGLLSIYEDSDHNQRTQVLSAWSAAASEIRLPIEFLGRHLQDRYQFWALSRLVLREGRAAEPLVPTLAELLATGNRYTAPVAAQTLAGLGASAASAVDALSAGAAHPDPGVATRCLEALAGITTDQPKLAAILRRAMLHEDADVRTHALAGMVVHGRIDAALALALVDALDDLDVGVRTAANALAPLGGPAVFEFVTRGEHPSPVVRAALSTLRSAFDGDGNPTADALRHAAMPASMPVRRAALATLERRPALAAGEFELVRAALASRDAGLAARAARVLAATTPPAAQFVPLLAPWLDAPESLGRDAVRDALASMGDDATDALVELLRQRQHSVAILSLFGEREQVPATVWPFVESACASAEIRVRTAARRVLARHGASAALPAPVRSGDELRVLRERLELAARSPRESIETLMALSHDAPASIRAGALRAMVPVVGDQTLAGRILAVATASLGAPELELVDAAAGLLRAARGAAVEPLLQSLCDGDALLRARAGLLIRDCDPRLTPSIPGHVVERLLETDRSTLRATAIQRVAGVEPAVLRPMLAALLDDPDQSIRWQAFARLEQIGAPVALLARLEAMALQGSAFDAERAVGVIATVKPEGLDVLLRLASEAAVAARPRVFEVLANFGVGSRPACEAALRALHDADSRTAEAAAQALVAMELEPRGEHGARLLESFESLVLRPERARAAAILVLAIGTPAAVHWPVFDALSRSEDPASRLIAVRAMLAAATEDSQLESALASALESRPRGVAWALAELPGRADPARIVRFLLPHVASIDENLAQPLAEALVRTLPRVDVRLEAELVRAVLAKMADGGPGVAGLLAPVIGVATRSAPELVAPLAHDFEAKHADAAITALARSSPAAVAAWLGSGSLESDRRLLAALANVDGEDEERARLLAGFAGSDDPALRGIAFHGLAGCGRVGAAILAGLVLEASRTGDADTRWHASIARLGDTAELLAPGIIAALRARDAERELLLHDLSLCGPRGIAALEVMHVGGEDVSSFLINGLSAPGPRTRAAALRATLALRLPFEAIGPAVIGCLDDRDPEVRNWAAIALCALAREHAEAQPALRSILGVADPMLRARALSVFRILQSPLDLALLVESLDDSDATVRSAAARAIGELGTSAARCRTALRERLEDDEQQVRQAALEALRRIDG